MKKREVEACQTSIDTHPTCAPEGKTARRVKIIKLRTTKAPSATLWRNQSLYSNIEPLPPSLRTVREDQKGIHSEVSRICNHQPGWALWLL